MAYNFRNGWIVNPEAPSDSLEAKVPYVDNGTDACYVAVTRISSSTAADSCACDVTGISTATATAALTPVLISLWMIAMRLESRIVIGTPTLKLVVPRGLRATGMGISADLNFVQIFHTMLWLVKRSL